MNDKNMKRAQFLKECREAKGLSKAKLVQLIHFSSRTTVIRWEKGESFPDDETLLKLAEIFDVSLEELRAGERITKDESNIDFVINERDSSSTNNLKNKWFKYLFGIILLVFFIAFVLIMCFIYKRDKVEIYKLSLDSNNFIIDNSSLTLSKDVSILSLNKVEVKNEEEIENIRLYFIDDDSNERLIISGNNDNIYIEEKYGYKEYELYKLKDRDLYIEIKTDKNIYKGIIIDKTFVNEFNSFLKKDEIEKISYDSEEVEKDKFRIDEDFLLNQGFTYEEEVDKYVKSIQNKYYFLIDDTNIRLSIYLEDNYSVITLDAFSDYDNYLYTEYFNNKLVETKEISSGNEKNCNNKKCSTIDDYIQYITYLRNHF